MIPDIAIGGMVYVFLSLIFHKPFNALLLGFSIFWALAPEIDAGFFVATRIADKLLVLLGRKPAFKLVHHRMVHWPILWFLVPPSIIYYFFGTYMAALSAINLLCHFVHDSLPDDPGPQWIFPFGLNFYALSRERKIISRSRKEFEEAVRKERCGKTLSIFQEFLMGLEATPESIALLMISCAFNLYFCALS